MDASTNEDIFPNSISGETCFEFKGDSRLENSSFDIDSNTAKCYSQKASEYYTERRSNGSTSRESREYCMR